jgi:pyruvate/oxaloacetate carboxyltransferase
MSRVKIITHNGRDIIVSDLTYINDDRDILNVLDEVKRIVKKRNEPFCTVYDITGSYLNEEVIKRAKALKKSVDATGLSRGMATVGVDSRSKRIIGNFLKPDLYFAKNMEDALAHLSTEKKR